MARSCRRQLRPGEEGQVGAGMAFSIRVEQVIGARVVLVDALLHEPHSENACVEIEILLCGSSNRRDVVQACDAVHVLAPYFRAGGQLCRGMRLACVHPAPRARTQLMAILVVALTVSFIFLYRDRLRHVSWWQRPSRGALVDQELGLARLQLPSGWRP